MRIRSIRTMYSYVRLPIAAYGNNAVLASNRGHRLAATKTHLRRHFSAACHFHRAVLEFRDLSDGVERRIGEQIRRRFVKAAWDEYCACGRAVVRRRGIHPILFLR